MDSKIIYIEPEDDITDVVGKIKNSTEASIRLSPMRGSIALRSLINLRIIQRTIREAGKQLTIITTDPTTLRLSATAGIEAVRSADAAAEIDEDSADQPEPADKSESKSSDNSHNKSDKRNQEKAEEAEENSEAAKDAAKDSDVIVSSELEDESDNYGKKKKSAIPDFLRYRKWIIIGLISLIVIVAGIITATIVFAPSATIEVSIKTSRKSLSDFHTSSIQLVTDEKNEDIEAGKFQIEAVTEKVKDETEFEATGERDEGTKASGKIMFNHSFSAVGQFEVPAGTTFTIDGLVYTLSKNVSLSANATNCSGVGFGGTCTIVGEGDITANGRGEQYNLSAQTSGSGWTTSRSGLNVTGNSAIAGGTTKLVQFVSADDIKKASESISADITCSADSPLKSFPSNLIIIKDARKIVKSDPISSPAVDQPVSGNAKPKLTVEASCTLYGIERAKVERFITRKVEDAIKNEQGRKIFKTGIETAWIRRNADTDGVPTTAKLESSAIEIGPDITVESIFNRAKGEKIGDVRNWLSSTNGVANVQINVEPFWNGTIPTDPNQVIVNIKSQIEGE
jgi:hypothetical protein